jgi:hypothetical protein
MNIIILILYYIVFISIPFDYCTDYYLKIGGTDSASCATYNDACSDSNSCLSYDIYPCATLDHIVLYKHNGSNGNHIVYIDVGIHNYTITSYNYSSTTYSIYFFFFFFF